MREPNQEAQRLWNKNWEMRFFREALNIAGPDKLFYLTDDGRYLVYWPKSYKGVKATLQRRNAYIGSFTEQWVRDLLEPIAREVNGYSMENVVCEKLELSNRSPADVAITRVKRKEVEPEDIILLVEVKMSVVWNWLYTPQTKELTCIDDYTTHTGNHGLLRSDTMLKAIGKSVEYQGLGWLVSAHSAYYK